MQDTNDRRSNAARTEATRTALITAARKLFTDKGYAETSTPEIVRTAGITRGALYHHFADKTDLFRAVLRAEYEAVSAEIDQAVRPVKSDAISSLMQGSRGYFAAMRDPGRVRLMLLDGPAVLGREEIDQIDYETSAGALRLGLNAAMEAGTIRSLPLNPLVSQLSAMFDRAALAVASGESEDDHLTVVEALIGALRSESPSGQTNG